MENALDYRGKKVVLEVKAEGLLFLQKRLFLAEKIKRSGKLGPELDGLFRILSLSDFP